MSEKIQVLLVEDHPEYREIIEFALGKEPDMVLISKFGTAEGALRHLQDRQERSEPDIILLDLNLPGMGGLSSIPYFNIDAPQAKIIILSQSDQEDDVLRSITLGAAGYLLKSSTLRDITEGIRTVMEGGAIIDSGLAKFILHTLKKTLPKKIVEQMLTARELEVLTLLAQGLVKKEIGEQLKIRNSTVVTHVVHIYEKLNVNNAASAINKAHLLGLFPPETDA